MLDSFYYDDNDKLHVTDFSMVIDYGRDIDMKQICGCVSNLDGIITMDWCEKNCSKYYRCDNIALADDILKVYEGSYEYDVN